MPDDVIVCPYAVNVDPTLRLFLVARSLPTRATYSVDDPSMVVPAVTSNEFTSATWVLPGDVVPVTVIGSTKVPPGGAAPPTVGLPSASALPRLPSVPGSIADCRLVVPLAIDCPSGPVGAVVPSVIQRCRGSTSPTSRRRLPDLGDLGVGRVVHRHPGTRGHRPASRRRCCRPTPSRRRSGPAPP